MRLSQRGLRLFYERRRLLRLPAVNGPDGAAASPDGPPAGGQPPLSCRVSSVARIRLASSMPHKLYYVNYAEVKHERSF